jgi:ADP-heptose:LPS heptosyltransferase
MKRILIFKTDRIGDLVNISPVFANLLKNFPNSEIFLVCSKYNSSVAKYYTFLSKIFIFDTNFIFFLLKNFKYFFFKKFDIILQLDGKNHSYLSSIFINSKKKSCIKFIKVKNLFGKKINVCRPGAIISSFFNIVENCIEDYTIKNNKNYHYLTLYLKLLENLEINIHTNEHFLPYTPKTSTNFPNPYFHFHIDDRWCFFDKKIYYNLEKKIDNLSKNNRIFVTSNFNGNNFFNDLYEKFKNNTNIYFKNNATVDDLIDIIYKSHTVISSHTGFIVHVAAAFKKKIIDIVPDNIFNELERWIPFGVNYSRYSLNNFLNAKF